MDQKYPSGWLDRAPGAITMSSAANRPRVTFFVQAYNTAAFVGECLESILNQRGVSDFEVLVIDDASTDATAQEIARFKDSRLHVVRHDRNQGAIATANEGYAYGSAPFIVRVDSDDRLRPEFLQRALPLLEAHTDAGMVYGDVALIDEHGHVSKARGAVDRPNLPAHANELLPLLLNNYIPAPTTLVRREALTPLLPIPIHYRFLDWYLTTGIAEQWNSIYVDDVLADYRVHGNNMHQAMTRDRSGEATSRQVLDRLFDRPHRSEEKRRWRRRVYASCYLTYAEKYFGLHMNPDARRCYLMAAAYQPGVLFTWPVARHLAAVLGSRNLYESLKARALTRARSGSPAR
jgi:glycosyltransferase involved in cell wall biosynthesis